MNRESRRIAHRLILAFFAVACLIGLMADSFVVVIIITVLTSGIIFAGLSHVGDTPGP